ncbi:hypothetical protein GQ457_07G027570 [Hibiscus cannabinus]
MGWRFQAFSLFPKQTLSHPLISQLKDEITPLSSKRCRPTAITEPQLGFCDGFMVPSTISFSSHIPRSC